jgi:hypothetical protein
LSDLPLAAGAQHSGELRKRISFEGGSYLIDQDQGTELARWLDSIPNLLD